MNEYDYDIEELKGYVSIKNSVLINLTEEELRELKFHFEDIVADTKGQLANYELIGAEYDDDIEWEKRAQRGLQGRYGTLNRINYHLAVFNKRRIQEFQEREDRVFIQLLKETVPNEVFLKLAEQAKILAEGEAE